jgi:RND superfamily putative drug exporter
MAASTTRASACGPNIAARIGGWSVRHRKTAILGWFAFTAAAFVLGGVVGTKTLSDADALPGESGRAAKIYAAGNFDEGDPETVLVQNEGKNVRSEAFQSALRELELGLGREPGISEIRAPTLGRHTGLISRDGHSALVQFRFGAQPAPAGRSIRLESVLAAVKRSERAHPAFRIGEYGDASVSKALADTTERDFHRAELLSIPLTLAILLVAFGAIIAAGIPLLLALTAVVGAIGLLAFASHLWPADDAATSVILLIGLAVGVDYSLFYIRREREERAAGKGSEAAVEAAAATSGRAVLVSGLTVLIAMGGMFLTGSKELTSVAVGTMLVVATAVAGSVTVLPALLSSLGDRVERGRLPFLGSRAARPSRLLGAAVDRVLRRPLLSTVLATSALVIVALPAFALHTNNAGETALPHNLEIAKTYERLQQAFPGGPQPAYVALRAENVRTEAFRDAFEDLRRRALASGEMKGPIEARFRPDGKVAVITVPLAGSGTDARSEHALELLRERVVPGTFGRLPGVEVGVTGVTAASMDFNDLLQRRAPMVFAFVLGLAFLLLLTAFRSIVVAAKAIVLNMLSVGAAYGLLVAVFQWGWGESVFDFKSTHGVTSWLPLFLFVVLFGLSMDYHVFILTRVREAVDRGLGTEEAVAEALRATAGTVTSAALVMVGVFSIFATLSQIELKQLGVGLASAILIDATVVRAVLLPATMKLLGRWNWYLPRWLQWLPRISHTPEPAAGGYMPVDARS